MPVASKPNRPCGFGARRRFGRYGVAATGVPVSTSAEARSVAQPEGAVVAKMNANTRTMSGALQMLYLTSADALRYPALNHA